MRPFCWGIANSSNIFLKVLEFKLYLISKCVSHRKCTNYKIFLRLSMWPIVEDRSMTKNSMLSSASMSTILIVIVLIDVLRWSKFVALSIVWQCSPRRSECTAALLEIHKAKVKKAYKNKKISIKTSIFALHYWYNGIRCIQNTFCGEDNKRSSEIALKTLKDT